MIEALKSEEIIQKVGGRFKLTALIQRRLVELLQGARPLVEKKRGMTNMEVVIQEILEDKIGIDYEASDVSKPEAARATRPEQEGE
ncbi:MAG: DNA-directed RNA polymerase subunit omega [Planctomycetota bacterium]